MPGKRLAVFLLCFGVLLTPGNAAAQDVKSTFDKSVDFTKYKKYTWGSNYLLTQQPKDVQERINMAIIDSINRNLQARGFVEDDKNPDFRVTYEAGGQPQADVGAQRPLYASDMVGYYWGDLSGISSDVWISSLAKVKITVTDAATKRASLGGDGVQEDSRPHEIQEQTATECRQIHSKDDEGFSTEKVIAGNWCDWELQLVRRQLSR